MGGEGGQAAIVRLGVVVTVALLVGVLVAAPAHARTFTVNSTAKPGTGGGGCNATQCTLTEAVNEAIGNGESDTINFTASLSGEIDLRNTPSRGGFSILNDAPAMDLPINGPRARVLAVNGNDETRAFGIAAGANTAIKSLAIKNGRATRIGGGIYNNTGASRLINSTISANTTSGQGGGILNGGSPGVPVLPTNTIIAGNTAGTHPDASGAFSSQGYNLIGNTSGSAGWGSSDLPNSNPLLGPLHNNGGPTNTHALRTGSPAINTIPRATNGCGTDITTDQRGLKRPQGSNCDTGSFEKKKMRRR